MPSATAKRTLKTMSLVSVLGCGTWFFLIEEQLYCLPQGRYGNQEPLVYPYPLCPLAKFVPNSIGLGVPGGRHPAGHTALPDAGAQSAVHRRDAGKQLVVLIGQPKACALAVRNVRAMRRLTNLAARLRQQDARREQDQRSRQR